MSASLKFVFLSTVLAFCLYTAGLKNLDNGKASILASVEPVAATLIGVILYKETLSAGEIFGIILVMVAIVMCNLTNKEKNNKIKMTNAGALLRHSYLELGC